HLHGSHAAAAPPVLRHLPGVQVQPHSDHPNLTEWIWINQFPHVEKSGADGTRVNDQHISTPAHDSAILHWQCLYQSHRQASLAESGCHTDHRPIYHGYVVPYRTVPA